LDVGK